MNRKILKTLGFRKNWIYEVIATTTDGKQKNAAPIGIWTKNFSDVEMEIYKNSKTYKNILLTNELVVNFFDDIKIFYRAIYEKNKLKYKKARKVCAPVLREAKSWLELKIKMKKEINGKTKFISDIVSYNINEKKLKLFNRAEALTLESLIKATKIPFRGEDINENLRIIKKVAPNSKYGRIVEKILR
ncbi:MAG: DUF447 family protein [Candidatus Altiarchaeota archaeon]